MSNTRDNFSKLTKEILAKRVGYKCSNPTCRKMTVGPHTREDKTINLGVAAHITAASIGGPRFNEDLEPEQRKSIRNAIWLCQNCAKLIDSDIYNYSVDELLSWKINAEGESMSLVLDSNDSTNSLFDDRIKVYEKLYYEIREADNIVRELIELENISESEKKEIIYYVGLQIAKFTDDNSFYLQNEIVIQCIGTFIGVDDIFDSDKLVGKENLELYRKNIRATQKLLKSVNSKGIIDVTLKTPIMEYYSELVKEQKKNDFL